VNTTDPIAVVREKMKLPSGTLAVVDALGIAVKEDTRINTAMLGAIVRLAGFCRTHRWYATRRRVFSVVNIPSWWRPICAHSTGGYQETRVEEITDDGKFTRHRFADTSRNWAISMLRWEESSLMGSTAHKDLSASRQGIYPYIGATGASTAGCAP